MSLTVTKFLSIQKFPRTTSSQTERLKKVIIIVRSDQYPTGLRISFNSLLKHTNFLPSKKDFRKNCKKLCSSLTVFTGYHISICKYKNIYEKHLLKYVYRFVSESMLNFHKSTFSLQRLCSMFSVIVFSPASAANSFSLNDIFPLLSLLGRQQRH